MAKTTFAGSHGGCRLSSLYFWERGENQCWTRSCVSVSVYLVRKTGENRCDKWERCFRQFIGFGKLAKTGFEWLCSCGVDVHVASDCCDPHRLLFWTWSPFLIEILQFSGENCPCFGSVWSFLISCNTRICFAGLPRRVGPLCFGEFTS